MIIETLVAWKVVKRTTDPDDPDADGDDDDADPGPEAEEFDD